MRHRRHALVLSAVVLAILAGTWSMSAAQLDRLRKSKSFMTTPPAETPMVEIPAGEFMMGSDGTQALEDERPSHRVWLDAFSIDLHEVTTAQYAAFLSADKRAAPWQWETVDLVQHGDRPVIGVDWRDAEAFCTWKGKRLPTEAEWEKAARGTDARPYPWGNQAPTGDLANFALGARFSYNQVLFPVRSHEAGKSPYGLYHMAGNAYEWVQDWYGTNYYDSSPDRNPPGPSQGQFKVLRGGSWSDLPKYLLTYRVSDSRLRRRIVIRDFAAPSRHKDAEKWQFIIPPDPPARRDAPLPKALFSGCLSPCERTTLYVSSR